MSLKIAKIGATSVGFTTRLMGDLRTVHEHTETAFAFADIKQKSAWKTRL